MKTLPIFENEHAELKRSGRCTLRITAECQWRPDVEPKEHSAYPGYWIPYCSDGRMANGEPGDRQNDCGIRAPWIAGERAGATFQGEIIETVVSVVNLERGDNQWTWVVTVEDSR